MSLSESLPGPYDAVLILFVESARVLSHAWMDRRAAGRRAVAESSQALRVANESYPGTCLMARTPHGHERCALETRDLRCEFGGPGHMGQPLV